MVITDELLARWLWLTVQPYPLMPDEWIEVRRALRLMLDAYYEQSVTNTPPPTGEVVDTA